MKTKNKNNLILNDKWGYDEELAEWLEGATQKAFGAIKFMSQFKLDDDDLFYIGYGSALRYIERTTRKNSITHYEITVHAKIAAYHAMSDYTQQRLEAEK